MNVFFILGSTPVSFGGLQDQNSTPIQTQASFENLRHTHPKSDLGISNYPIRMGNN